LQGKGYQATLKEEVKLILSSVKSGANIAVDIGANVGGYTEELLLVNPNMKVHIFEPSKTNVEILKKKFMNIEVVTINSLAVSEKTGVATLFSDKPGSGLGSLSKRKLEHFEIDFNETESVSTIRFEDYWINTLNYAELDVVKIDVEGYELGVLKGFGKALSKTKSIQFEFGGTCIDTRVFFQDFWYFLCEKNYSIYRITPFGLEHIDKYRECDETFYYTNFLALNNLYH